MKNAFYFAAICTTLALLSLQSLAHAAESFAKKCPELDACIKAVSELTGEKYIFDPSVKGKIGASENMELTRQNANLLLTKALQLNGFTRVPMGDANTFQILKIRDARDTLLPKVTADSSYEPRLPETWDWMLLNYKAKHPESVERMARTVRSFMASETRIVPIDLSGQIMVTAAAPDLKNVYEILRDMDQSKPSKALLEKWKQREMEYKKEKQKEGVK